MRKTFFNILTLAIAFLYNGNCCVAAYYKDAENVLFPPEPLNYGTDTIAVLFDSGRNSFDNEACLKNKRVAWIRGYGFDKYIMLPMDITEVNNSETGANMLRAGRIDYYVDALEDLEESLEMLDGLEIKTLKELGLYYAFIETDFGEKLMEIYVQKFPGLKQRGRIREIYAKYELDYPL